MRFVAPLLPRSIRWLVVLVLAGFIFYVSLITVPPETVIDRRFELIPLDKWRHFVAYAALGYALAYATTDWNWKHRRLALFVVGVTILYGFGIELAQSFVPERYFSVLDTYANVLGGILVIPYYAIRHRINFEPLGEFIQTVTDRA